MFCVVLLAHILTVDQVYATAILDVLQILAPILGHRHSRIEVGYPRCRSLVFGIFALPFKALQTQRYVGVAMTV